LGTYTGWNLMVNTPKDECTAMGSFIPFATTKAQRLAAGDPRPSLEERYATHSRYVQAVEVAAERLVAARLVLPQDARAYVEAAMNRALGLPPLASPSSTAISARFTLPFVLSPSTSSGQATPAGRSEA